MTIFRFFWVLMVGTMLFLRPVAAKPSAPTIAWQTSWEVAQNTSRKTGKPIFIYFHAAWCGPCRNLDKMVWSDARVVRASRAWVPFKADLDTQTDLARRFDVKTPPMVVFLDGKARKVSSLLGFQDAPTMIKVMQSAAHQIKK